MASSDSEWVLSDFPLGYKAWFLTPALDDLGQIASLYTSISSCFISVEFWYR